MAILRQTIGTLVALGVMLPCFAQAPAQDEHAVASAVLTLEGKSFQGRVRADGIFGLFSVKGTLSFKDGLLIWSAKGSDESAPYETESLDGLLKFTSRVPGESGTYVDWSGTYDGHSVNDVRAIWTRAGEDDFIHDLFLPDVVSLVFKQKKD